ncbi:MAG TPA: hypothetical protein VM554_12800 [Acidisarcina sp.]|nr:hypothetical protein [Acidisarcina sp.]
MEHTISYTIRYWEQETKSPIEVVKSITVEQAEQAILAIREYKIQHPEVYGMTIQTLLDGEQYVARWTDIDGRKVEEVYRGLLVFARSSQFTLEEKVDSLRYGHECVKRAVAAMHPQWYAVYADGIIYGVGDTVLDAVRDSKIDARIVSMRVDGQYEAHGGGIVDMIDCLRISGDSEAAYGSAAKLRRMSERLAKAVLESTGRVPVWTITDHGELDIDEDV